MMVWLNGALLPVAQARIDPRDRGLLLADGLFETVCVRAGRLRLWDAHLARLRAGADALGLSMPPHELVGAIGNVLRANALADAAVRLTLTRGVGPRGIAPPETASPTLLVTAAPLVSGPPAPVLLCVARTVCRNERSPLSRLKTLNYLDGVLARREALARGFADAVVLNTRGRVAEATAANLFARIAGRWLTPPVSEGALPGVVRGALLAAGFGQEAPITGSELAEAEAVLLTNSLGVTGVSALEGRPLELGSGVEPGQLYERF